jgi:amino-acid N-acetyltransferase
MDIRRATESDIPAVEALLAAAGLPLEGAADALSAAGIVACDGADTVGAAAVELFGTAGLLRSVVVAADGRGTGVGRALVTAAEGVARGAGVSDLYLLTETAPDWFPRLGYAVVERAAAASRVGASIEFTTVCRDSGVPMWKAIGGPEAPAGDQAGR